MATLIEYHVLYLILVHVKKAKMATTVSNDDKAMYEYFSKICALRERTAMKISKRLLSKHYP